MKNGFTWKQVAERFKVAEGTTSHDWFTRKITLPLGVFRIIEKGSSVRIDRKPLKVLRPFWGQKLGKISKFKESVKLPSLRDKSYAEFYGVLLGDGCVYTNLSGFSITGNSVLDRNYVENYVYNLVTEVFGIKPKIYFSKQKKAIRCVLYCKEVAEFLVRNGFPKGKKKPQNPIIPLEFFKSKELLKACLRGINDSDGSIYPQSNSKIILDISITSSSLLDSSIKAFQTINFPINYTFNRIYLCGKEPVSSFLKVIGSSNQRHLIKYECFLKEGRVPLTKETESLLKV